MQYSDNPRKVYGKVNIIYSDSEISMDLSTETSGNGEISNPEQVYGSFLSPTIKACTMDGNSTMGGGYQMNGNGLITGWWSDVHSNENCDFVSPPWLKLNFLARPMIKWTLLGDNMLNQFPVDFDISIYQGDIIVDTREIHGNDKVGVVVYYSLPFIDITSAKITIYKWNKPNAKAKLLQFFDIVEEEYTGSDIKEFEVLEELCKDGDVGFGINSDTATFTIYNKDRKFDRGYLKSLMLLGRKVVPYIGIENENGEIEYTSFGTFYSEDWNIPQSDVWVKLKCIDKLSSLQKITYIGYPYTYMANLYDIAEDILIKSGFSNSQYNIDKNLKNDIVENGFMKKSSSWNCLQEVCYAGLCNAYIDRNDVLNIQKEVVNPVSMQIGASSIFSYKKQTRKTDFCNYVEVNYIDVEKTATAINAYESKITIDENSIKTMNVDYSGYVSDTQISFVPVNEIELVSFESGVNSGKFVLKNNNPNAITITVTIKGMSLSIKGQTVAVSDKNSIEKWGRQEYIYNDSDLIQSYDRAIDIGKLILERLKQGNGNIKINWRGNPALGLQDSFITADRFGSTDKCINQYNRYHFDGGLKQETRGRLINE